MTEALLNGFIIFCAIVVAFIGVGAIREYGWPWRKPKPGSQCPAITDDGTHFHIDGHHDDTAVQCTCDICGTSEWVQVPPHAPVAAIAKAGLDWYDRHRQEATHR